MSTLTQKHQVSPEIDSTVSGIKPFSAVLADALHKESSISKYHHDILLQCIDDFLDNMSPGNVAREIACVVGELQECVNEENAKHIMKLTYHLAEISAFVAQLGDAASKIKYLSLRDSNTGK